MSEPDCNAVEVIAFDVFGTVVDWCGGIAREAERIAPAIDGAAFARAWRAGYQPAMRRAMQDMASGAGGFVKLDALHRRILDEIVEGFGLAHLLGEAQRRELNLAWHRLPAWPDSVAGLDRLRRRYTICTLSNGNIGLLTEMAKNAGLPWDCILSAEVFRAYKPDARTYLGVAEVFDLRPAQVLLAAAHHDDLAGARACGLRTAYIERPHEFGADSPKDVAPRPHNDWHAADIADLAAQLGCNENQKRHQRAP